MGICPSSPTCPSNNQCKFESNGVTLAMACGWEFSGEELQSKQASSITQCMTLCAATTHCAAVTFAHDQCHMKRTFHGGAKNPDAITAYIYTFLASPTSYNAIPYNATIPPLFCVLPTTPHISLLTAPDRLLQNTAFDHPTLTPWLLSTSNATHSLDTTLGLSVHPATPSTPWTLSVAQHVTVTPYRSYAVVVRSRQDHAGNCVGRVTWRGAVVKTFVPGEGGANDRTSVMFPVWGKGEGEVGVGFTCLGDRGLEVSGVWMEGGWVE